MGQSTNGREKLSNVVAFWTMATTQLSIRSALSTAAHDLLTQTTESTSTRTTSTHLHSVREQHRVELPPHPECNSTSTGSLIAMCYVFNILAAILIVASCHKLSTVVKLSFMEVLFVVGFLIITFSKHLYALFCGVIVIGVAISIFELTVPPLATAYKVQATNALAAGAGMAQTLGSTVYVSMKVLNMSHLIPFYPFVIINVAGFFVFMALLSPPDNEDKRIEGLWSMDRELEIIPLIVGGPAAKDSCSTVPTKRHRKSSKNKCRQIFGLESISDTDTFYAWSSTLTRDLKEAVAEMKSVFIYLILFYCLEYYTNLGLLEHATISGSKIPISDQYRWFMFCYHLTQTIMRSMPLPECMESKLACIAIGQAIVTAIIFSHAVFNFITHIEVMMTLIVIEGILGSLAYLIGLRHARNASTNDEVKKLATILVLAADVIALGLGSLAAISTHGTFCQQKNYKFMQKIRKQSHAHYVKGKR